MEPTQEQLANRLNPTPFTVNTPTSEGLFRATGDFGSQIFKKNADGSYSYVDVPTLARTEITKGLTPDQYGNYGVLSGMNTGSLSSYGLNYLKNTYGFDYNSLPEYNMADLRLSTAPASYTGDLSTFFTNPKTATQSQTQTLNTPAPAGTPGTTPVPQGTQPQQATQQAPVGQLTSQSVPNQTYTIQSGDTLSRIAQTYGTTVGQLMSLNPQITDANKIYTGQKLNLTPAQQPNLQSVQQGINQATQQANQIQQGINQLGQTTPTTQTTSPTAPTAPTTSDFVKTWQDITTQLGLSDVKKAYTQALDDAKEIEDKKANEASDINNNPWYSEGKRQMELKKLDSKYETKLNTLSNYAKLYDAIYQEGRATAEFLATGVQRDNQFNIELAQKKQDALDALSDNNVVVSANGREVLVNKATGKVVADLGESKVTSGTSGLTDYQSIQAFIGISNKFQADAIVNQAIKGQTAVAIANQVIANPASATNQLKSLYSLVKNLDPDSAVREGEIGLANQTTSYLQRFQTTLDRITKGQVIAPDAAKALAQATVELASAWNDTAQRRIQQYQSQANTAGIGSQFSQYLSGFNITPTTNSVSAGSDWANDYNYTRDIQWARDAIAQGADEGQVRARLLTKYKEVNL